MKKCVTEPPAVWYTKNTNQLQKRRCVITEAVRNRFVWVLAAVAMVLALAVLPVGAESVDYAQTLDRLDRLQTMAQQYMEEKGSSADPVDLTLGFTRVGG